MKLETMLRSWWMTMLCACFRRKELLQSLMDLEESRHSFKLAKEELDRRDLRLTAISEDFKKLQADHLSNRDALCLAELDIAHHQSKEKDFVALLSEMEKVRADHRIAKDDIHRLNLHVASLNDTIRSGDAAHAKTKAQMQRLWQFIIKSRRMEELPLGNGSLRQVLHDSENQ